MPHPPAIILAGGRSSRMGEDKANVTLGSKTMLQHVIDRLQPQVSSLAINAPEGFEAPPGMTVVPDITPGHGGPLVGILTGLRHAISVHSQAKHLLTATIDSPFVPDDLVQRLEAALTMPGEIAIADSAGEMHPVCGLWPLSLADDLDAWLSRGEKPRVKAFLARHPVKLVDFPLIETQAGMLDPFLNINTPDELQRAHRFLEIP